ncbi:hypothetical protein IE53DRAFT_382078 [Violaceomyces palustris]|uniref:Uncharacterized protein n=1 Tax=Violaceomyces palustris TaxID=1673888 RepID=A0ACD0NNV6_9BASI|nr:hypothetical protein IE53DRAFT_382078 [Violaceomyces palustris]
MSKPFDQVEGGATTSTKVYGTLLLQDKKGRQREQFPIQRKNITVGRSMENDVRFLRTDVSRVHCEFDFNDESNVLLHVYGSNGVLLNGVRALPKTQGGKGTYLLKEGDLIGVSKQTFCLRLAPPKQESRSSSKENTSLPFENSTKVAATPLTSRPRRIRMSLVHSAQINTPAKSQSATGHPVVGSSTPSPIRSNGVSASPSLKKGRLAPKARRSLAGAVPSTPVVKGDSKGQVPKTAPPKQVFRLSSTSRRSMSPVKRMRAAPPMAQMEEEEEEEQPSLQAGGPLDAERMGEELQKGNQTVAEDSRGGETFKDDRLEEAQVQVRDEDNLSGDMIVMEEVVEDVAAPETEETVASTEMEATNGHAVQSESPAKTPAPSSSGSNRSKDDSRRKSRRESSFLGRAGPMADKNLGFYGEERVSPPLALDDPAHPSDCDEGPIGPEEMNRGESSHGIPSSPAPTPVSIPTSEGPRSPGGLSNGGMPRTPSRLSSPSKSRRVSLRTQTLLRTSAQYYDRMMQPRASPSSPSRGMVKSASMPTFPQTPRSVPLPPSVPCTPENKGEEEEQDEEEVDRSLSILEPEVPELEVVEESDRALPEQEEEEEKLVPGSGPSQSQRREPLAFSPARPAKVLSFKTPQMTKSFKGRQMTTDARRSKPRASLPAVARPTSLVTRVMIGPNREMAADLAASIWTWNGRKGLKETDPSEQGRVDEVGPDPEELGEALQTLFDAVQDEDTDEEGEETDRVIPVERLESLSNPNQGASPVTPRRDPRRTSLVDQVPESSSAKKGRSPKYGLLRQKMQSNPELAELISRKENETEKSMEATKKSSRRKSRGKRGSPRGKTTIPTSSLTETPDMRGLKHLMAEPKDVRGASTPDVSFLRHVFSIPETQVDNMDPQLKAVRHLFRDHEESLMTRSGDWIQDEEDGKALEDLMRTPAARKVIKEAMSLRSVKISDRREEVPTKSFERDSIEVESGCGEEEEEVSIRSPSARKSGMSLNLNLLTYSSPETPMKRHEPILVEEGGESQHGEEGGKRVQNEVEPEPFNQEARQDRGPSSTHEEITEVGREKSQTTVDEGETSPEAQTEKVEIDTEREEGETDQGPVEEVEKKDLERTVDVGEVVVVEEEEKGGEEEEVQELEPPSSPTRKSNRRRRVGASTKKTLITPSKPKSTRRNPKQVSPVKVEEREESEVGPVTPSSPSETPCKKTTRKKGATAEADPNPSPSPSVLQPLEDQVEDMVTENVSEPKPTRGRGRTKAVFVKTAPASSPIPTRIRTRPTRRTARSSLVNPEEDQGNVATEFTVEIETKPKPKRRAAAVKESPSVQVEEEEKKQSEPTETECPKSEGPPATRRGGRKVDATAPSKTRGRKEVTKVNEEESDVADFVEERENGMTDDFPNSDLTVEGEEEEEGKSKRKSTRSVGGTRSKPSSTTKRSTTRVAASTRARSKKPTVLEEEGSNLVNVQVEREDKLEEEVLQPKRGRGGRTRTKTIDSSTSSHIETTNETFNKENLVDVGISTRTRTRSTRSSRK